MAFQDLMDSVLQSLELGQHPVTRERRTRDRCRVRKIIPAVFLGDPGSPSIDITMRNLSTCGIGFVSRRSMTVGEYLVVPLYSERQASKLALCQVKNCRYVGKGMYAVGAEFESAYPDPQQTGKLPQIWLNAARRAMAPA